MQISKNLKDFKKIPKKWKDSKKFKEFQRLNKIPENSKNPKEFTEFKEPWRIQKDFKELKEFETIEGIPKNSQNLEDLKELQRISKRILKREELRKSKEKIGKEQYKIRKSKKEGVIIELVSTGTSNIPFCENRVLGLEYFNRVWHTKWGRIDSKK